MNKFTPCLWFDSQAEEAAQFYVSLFRNSRIVSVARYGAAAARASGRPEGSVMTVTFELERQPFLALNGGPLFRFTPAVSFMVDCQTQDELDGYWVKLTEGGQVLDCGWVTDKYGVTWQVVPAILGKMMQSRDPEALERVMTAMLGMRKLDLAALTQAYEGRAPG